MREANRSPTEAQVKKIEEAIKEMNEMPSPLNWRPVGRQPKTMEALVTIMQLLVGDFSIMVLGISTGMISMATHILVRNCIVGDHIEIDVYISSNNKPDF